MINLSAPLQEQRRQTYHYGELMFPQAGLSTSLVTHFTRHFENVMRDEPNPKGILLTGLGEYYAMKAVEQVLAETDLPTNAQVRVIPHRRRKDDQFVGFIVENTFGSDSTPKRFISPGLHEYALDSVQPGIGITFPSTPQ